MTKPSLPRDWMSDNAARRVHEAIRAGGGEARFVGGCVRDALAGRTIKDIDLATDLTPPAVIAALSKAGLAHAPTGLAHGTVTAIAEGRGIEVTTLRRDLATDGRRARVAFTDDWQADAARRDLTINALFAALDGTLFDYFGGGADLAAGRVRFVGDPAARMAEDHLRILRFFRFHADFARGDFDPPALAAALAARSRLARLSGERLRQETLKLLVARRGPETWRRMVELGIAAAYLPEAAETGRLQKVARLEAELDLAPDPLRRLAALVASREGDTVAARLRLSTAQRERLVALTAERAGFSVGDDRQLRRQVYALGDDPALDRLLLDWQEGEESGWRHAFQLLRSWPRPSFPLGGRDALALGLAPGPKVSAFLKKVEAWWIEGDFAADRAQCLARLARLVESGP